MLQSVTYATKASSRNNFCKPRLIVGQVANLRAD